MQVDNMKKEYANDLYFNKQTCKKIPLYVDDDSLNKKDAMLRLMPFK